MYVNITSFTDLSLLTLFGGALNPAPPIFQQDVRSNGPSPAKLYSTYVSIVRLTRIR